MEQRGSDSHTSEALIKYWMGTPDGWTICAYVGLCAMLSFPFLVLKVFIDLMSIEEEHCYQSTIRSIERGGKQCLTHSD